jgi:hypothetical protein
VYAYYVYMYCIVAVVEAGGMCTGVQGLIYVGVYIMCILCFVCYTPCCTSLVPLHLGGGGGRATIADSHRKLGTLLGSSRGYILPAGVG